MILVGAGLGDRLIAVAGLEAVQAGDVVLHDRLVSPRLVAEARGDALVIDVGVRGGEGGAEGRQGRIAERMISLAREGKLVVRLKGGDPFVFGRGGEEVSALVEAGIAVEVIPGVSAAVAAPGLAGIPVTDRRAASAFTVVSGTEAAGAPPVDWEALARVGGTIVVLMGGRRTGAISERLIAAGLDPGTPAAAISQAGSSAQRSVFSTLGRLGRTVAEAALETPITLVIGEVVALTPTYEHPPSGEPRATEHVHAAPQGSRIGDGVPAAERGAGQRTEAARESGAGTLAGLRVLVTRPAGQAEPLARLLRMAGAVPVVMPAIEILPPDDGYAAIDGAVSALGEGGFNWAVFTSANGVERVWQRLASAGLDARAFGGTRVAAIGPATAAALEERGIRADLVPAPHTTRALLQELLGALLDAPAATAAGSRVLLARSADGDPALAEGLRAAGAAVTDAAAYRAATAAGDDAVLADLRGGRIDAVTFTSPSTVRGLVELAGVEPLRATRIACIGPVTAAAARAAGLSIQAEAAEHTAAGLVAALAAADP